MSLTRFTLLEFAVGSATGVVSIPVVFIIAALLAKVVGPKGGSATLIGIGFVWLAATIVLPNIFTARTAKRWSD